MHDAINVLEFITVFVLFGFRTRTRDPPPLSSMNSTPAGCYARIGMFFRKCQNPNTSPDPVWVTRVFSSRKSKSGRFAEPDAPRTPVRFRPWGWSSREIGFVFAKKSPARSQRCGFARFRRRTPGPPPFSSMNSTPGAKRVSTADLEHTFSRARKSCGGLREQIGQAKK